MRILCKIFDIFFSTDMDIFFFFVTKNIISARYVRHISPRWDVCRSLMAKYLYLNNPDLNKKKKKIHC